MPPLFACLGSGQAAVQGAVLGGLLQLGVPTSSCANSCSLHGQCCSTVFPPSTYPAQDAPHLCSSFSLSLACSQTPVQEKTAPLCLLPSQAQATQGGCSWLFLCEGSLQNSSVTLSSPTTFHCAAITSLCVSNVLQSIKKNRNYSFFLSDSFPLLDHMKVAFNLPSCGKVPADSFITVRHLQQVMRTEENKLQFK